MATTEMNCIGGGVESYETDYKTAVLGGSSWVDVTCGFNPKFCFLTYVESGTTYMVKYDIANSKVYQKVNNTENDVTSSWLNSVVKSITNGVSAKFSSSNTTCFVFIG